jgi:hypothetical protein
MAELIVTETGTGKMPVRHMDWATFSRVVDILEQDHERSIIVSADGPAPPAWPRMLDRLGAGKFRAAVYVGSGQYWQQVHERIDYIFDAGSLISQLSAGASPGRNDASGLALLRGCPKVNFFLGVSSARPSVDGLRQLLAAAPHAKVMILGAGWKDWAGGPRANAKELPAQDSEGLLSLISELTDRGVQSYFGCGLALCSLARNQLGRLAGMNVRWPLAHCQPEFRIDPAGVVGYCRRIPQPAVNLLEVGSVPKVRERFAPLQMMADLCPRAGAAPCRSGATKACGRGCLADTLASWRGGTTKLSG